MPARVQIYRSGSGPACPQQLDDILCKGQGPGERSRSRARRNSQCGAVPRMSANYRIDASMRAPSGKTLLRDHTYARPADAQSFGDYHRSPEVGDVVLGENERVVCVERLHVSLVEQPVVVHEERVQEKTVHVPKLVARTTTAERPVIQPLRKPIQIVREIPVERIIEKPYKRKVYIERIIEQVVEVYKVCPNLRNIYIHVCVCVCVCVCVRACVQKNEPKIQTCVRTYNRMLKWNAQSSVSWRLSKRYRSRR